MFHDNFLMFKFQLHCSNIADRKIGNNLYAASMHTRERGNQEARAHSGALVRLHHIRRHITTGRRSLRRSGSMGGHADSARRQASTRRPAKPPQGFDVVGAPAATIVTTCRRAQRKGDQRRGRRRETEGERRHGRDRRCRRPSASARSARGSKRSSALAADPPQRQSPRHPRRGQRRLVRSVSPRM